MPKVERVTSGHRNSVSTASAAGGGARSSSWSQQDDETLIRARAQGLNWNQISPKHFPSKSANACRKRHERLMEKQNADQWDGVRLEVLAEAYMEVRSEMWRILGAKVNEKWQLVEQKVMEKGLKNLTQAYRQAQTKRDDGAFEGLRTGPDSGIGLSDVYENSYAQPYTSTRSVVVTQLNNNVDLPRLGPVPRTGMAYRPRIANTDPNQPMNTCAPKAASGTRKGCRGETHEAVTERPSTSTDLLLLNSLNSPNNTDTTPSPSVASEGSLEADLDEIDVRKELLVDRLMLQFYSIFDAQNGPLRQHHGSSESPGGSLCKGMVSNPSSSKSTIKHGRSFEEDGDGKESGDRPRKRPRKVSNDDTIPNHEKKKHLACPFFKHDPTKTCITKSCSGPGGWKDIPRLKEHIYRRHTLAPRCVRCCQTFKDEGELAEHQRAPVACVVRMQEPLEGLTQEQVEQLKRRKSMFQAGSEEEKWKIVYMICFPDTAPGDMPTPYYDNDITGTNLRDQSPKDPSLAQYEAYMNRELPRKVRKELETAIGKLFGPLEETLKNQLEGLIRNCQERLSRDFANSRESAHAKGLVATSELAGPSDNGTHPQLGATATPSALAPYTVPMDSSFEIWQGMDATFNFHTSTYPDSAYYSETNPLPSDPWWPATLDAFPSLANYDAVESGMMSRLESHGRSTENESDPSYTCKGKGRADEATGD